MTLDQRRTATIEDVAATAGVSRAAVSKVLRNAYGVSDAMRERVTAAMTELDYRPRVAARAMRGRTFTIGIEIPDFGNQFFTRMLNGAMRALAGTDYQVVIAPAEEGSREGLRAIEALIDRQVDGVIAVSPRVGQEALERIATRTPVVMFGRSDTSDEYDTVTGDDVAGANAAITHLLELGHVRIAHLTLHESDEAALSPHGVRLREYRAAMSRTGIDETVLWTDEGQDAAYAVVRAAIESGWTTTALFAAHDELAIGALRAVAETGSALSVVGYDDVPIAAHPGLGLTTVHQPGDLMGERAIQLLLERIDGRTAPVHEVFVPDLRVRTSTRPVA
ncbi:LacI family DNA-binding transcriptional regulator [Microbacterium sp. CFBP9034]|uniref:LacI family DNA-binding transcriptional regulator n=1 Tax=Microbacterium sp. CFBP9034 TaxID=3096540 RepID=UPI002A6B1EBD|nr:LacI family DNA-binding transcriptional regulator [Microbacterium sp. CFBP9034]MDY0908819.1 LacI family DNA-binding transcriptional regulator [Microbacterium sp. CFBP9034]